MKRSFTFLLVLALLAALCSAAFAAGGGIQVTAEGTPVVWTDAQPFIDENGRTLVPLRAVAEALDLEVDWDPVQREAIFTRTDWYLGDAVDMVIRFPIGSRTASYDSYFYNNGTGITPTTGTVEMDTAAVIINDRTYAPVRYLAEFFGWHVAWDGDSRTVYIGAYSLLDRGDFTGYYTDSYSYADITRSGDIYAVEVSLYRLTGLTGTGTVHDGVLTVSGTVDADGSGLTFTIQAAGPGEILLTITDSTWTYFSPGDTYTFSY